MNFKTLKQKYGNLDKAAAALGVSPRTLDRMKAAGGPEFRTAVILPDPHLDSREAPHPSFELAVRFCEATMPDEVVLDGDLLDFGYISRFTVDDIKGQATANIKADYALANTYTKRLKDRTGKLVFLEGNHDNRVSKVVEKYPALTEGYIELENNLKNIDVMITGYNNYEANAYHINSNLAIVHGFGSNGKEGGLLNHLHQQGKSVVLGHFHHIAAASVVYNGKPMSANTIGCLCAKNPSYLRGVMPKWENGFGIVYLMPDDTFYFYQVRIINDQFMFGDKLWTL